MNTDSSGRTDLRRPEVARTVQYIHYGLVEVVPSVCIRVYPWLAIPNSSVRLVETLQLVTWFALTLILSPRRGNTN